MSLLDVLNEMKQDGFDPNENKGGSFEDLPDGHYMTSLTGATHNFKNNRDFLMLTFTVESGEYKGRKQNIFPKLETVTVKGTPMPAGVLKREIGNLQILGACLESPVPDACFAHATTSEAYEDLADFFQDLKGKRVLLTKKTKPNPRNPKYPYENFYFDKCETVNPAPDQVDDNVTRGTNNQSSVTRGTNNQSGVTHGTNKTHIPTLSEVAQTSGLVKEDPFAGTGAPLQIDDADLPF